MADLVEATTVPSPQYLHRLELGIINVGRSRHLTSLAKVLQLTAEDMRIITGQPSNEEAVDVRSPYPLTPAYVASQLALELGHDSGSLEQQWPTVGAFALGDSIVVLDRTQTAPKLGQHFVVLDKDGAGQDSERTLALYEMRVGQDTQGDLKLVGDELVVALADAFPQDKSEVGGLRFTILGRIVHKGANL